MQEELLQWDRQTLIYLNNLGSEPYDFFWVLITDTIHWIPLFLLFIVLLFRYDAKQIAFKKLIWLIALTLFISLLTYLAKNGFARVRPNNDLALQSAIRILANPTDYSFFSGHAASSFSITSLLYLFLREKTKWIALLFLWPLLFAWSRIYVGVHYPFDILVGALIGVLSGILFFRLYQYPARRKLGQN